MSTTAALAAARGDLAAALDNTGHPVHQTVPETLQPPCLVIQAGDPYLELEETTFDGSDYLARLELFVLSDYQANDQAIDGLDAMLQAVLPALRKSGWAIDGFGAPGPYNTTDWLAYGVRVSLTRFVTIE